MTLTSEYYQTLLSLLNAAIAAGDLSGGSDFDKTTLLNLEQQAQSFASLPTATAGMRVMDDSFNYPLSLLLARLRAGLRSWERAQTTSLSSRGPVCHLPNPLPANRPETGLTPVGSEPCAR